MKRFLTLIFCLAISFIGYTQPCVITGTPGNQPGVFPVPDSIPCIERNTAYDYTMQLQNFDSITLSVPLLGNVTAAVIWTQIDSIVNLPCGISWASDSITYDPHETGCIRVSGTSKEIVGQYPVGIYITMQVDVPQLGVQTINGELKELAAQGGVQTDYNYVSRVIEQGDPCPARNVNASAASSGNTCPPFGVDITGNLNFCGGTETLTAVPKFFVGTPTYMWNDNSTGNTLDVTTSGTYSVTVTDQNGTAEASVTVDANTGPTAGFTSAINGLTVDFTNTSTTATSYAWDFDDGNNSTATDPTHTFGADGTYNVQLTATNNCGSDIASANITVVTPPCIVVAPSDPGVYPDPDNIPCIERLNPYDFTMQVKAFDTLASAFGFPILADTMRIDSIGNLPCGINWSASRLTYLSGETGCIRVSGTSREIVGQYPLEIYMTISLSIPGIGEQTFSGELNDLQSQLEDLAGDLGFDFKYVSRVINQGDNCPARDTSADGVSSGNVCPPLGVDIEGIPTICDGAATTLTAVAKYETGTVTYEWSDSSTDPSLTVSVAGNYSVTVTDQNGTATESVTVGTGSAPVADFTPVATVGIVTINQLSTGASTYFWDFGDGGTSTQASPTHTYTSNGTKTIILIVGNTCGNDTSVQTVTIMGVFVTSIEYDLTFDMFPNPSTGTVALQFTAENAKEVYELNIFDLSGKNVYREKITSASGMMHKQLDLNALPSGVYTLRLDSEKGFGVKKLILN